jgi:hypothetical protein
MLVLLKRRESIGRERLTTLSHRALNVTWSHQSPIAREVWARSWTAVGVPPKKTFRGGTNQYLSGSKVPLPVARISHDGSGAVHKVNKMVAKMKRNDD